MENMIKVRAMRAAGIACFLVLAIIGAWIFTTPSGDIAVSYTHLLKSRQRIRWYQLNFHD